jgi:anti-anti-sigma regulatory factor
MQHMSHKQSHHLPQDIYHRIYWYAKRNVDPRVIAHTLKIPLRTVERIIEKLSSAENLKPIPPVESEDHLHAKQSASQPYPKEFLDVFAFTKTRYTVVDFNGMVTKANAEKLDSELRKLLASDWKAVALRMADVKAIDEEGFGAIAAFYEAFVNMRRFTAILDPSPELDAFLEARDPDVRIPVFGTESAFESKAFR